MIVVAGEALVDVITRPDGEVVRVPGGGPFNTARAIGRLGVPVAWAGVLSTDADGRALAAELAADGVSLDLVQRTDRPTTTALAELDPGGEAHYRFVAAGTSAPALDGDRLASALPADLVALHVGTLGLVFEPIATALASLVAGAGRGVIVMVDPNCRPTAIEDADAYRARLGRILDRADVVKASVGDIAFLGFAPASRVLVITDGPRAIRVRHDGVATTVDAPAADVADTVGAGDTFGGALLASLVHAGLDRSTLGDATAVLEAVRFAARASARVCERPGADPPTLAELGGWDA